MNILPAAAPLPNAKVPTALPGAAGVPNDPRPKHRRLPPRQPQDPPIQNEVRNTGLGDDDMSVCGAGGSGGCAIATSTTGGGGGCSDIDGARRRFDAAGEKCERLCNGGNE